MDSSRRFELPVSVASPKIAARSEDDARSQVSSVRAADVDALADRLLAYLGRLERCVVAFSGGVDSTVVAAAAWRALGERAIAVTGISPSVSAYQVEWARRVAEEIGIQHLCVQTDEIERADYRRNDAQRCYYCKQTLYATLEKIAGRFPEATLCSGTNADDLGDHRPGLRAGDQARVATPLADLNLDKAAVRRIARSWQLSNSELPAAPCLASRLAYGVSVTPERLRLIERAETWLREHGFETFRVRLHPDDLARIEVPPDQFEKCIAADHLSQLVPAFEQLGFRYITLDLQGFRSGNLNQLVQIETSHEGRPDS